MEFTKLRMERKTLPSGHLMVEHKTQMLPWINLILGTVPARPYVKRLIPPKSVPPKQPSVQPRQTTPADKRLRRSHGAGAGPTLSGSGAVHRALLRGQGLHEPGQQVVEAALPHALHHGPQGLGRDSAHLQEKRGEGGG